MLFFRTVLSTDSRRCGWWSYIVQSGAKLPRADVWWTDTVRKWPVCILILQTFRGFINCNGTGLLNAFILVQYAWIIDISESLQIPLLGIHHWMNWMNLVHLHFASIAYKCQQMCIIMCFLWLKYVFSRTCLSNLVLSLYYYVVRLGCVKKQTRYPIFFLPIATVTANVQTVRSYCCTLGFKVPEQ